MTKTLKNMLLQREKNTQIYHFKNTGKKVLQN
jgi:hypothetical protein